MIFVRHSKNVLLICRATPKFGSLGKVLKIEMMGVAVRFYDDFKAEPRKHAANASTVFIYCSLLAHIRQIRAGHRVMG